eukprot:15431584-Alexandrium_andersonii.AAC.1
MPTPPGHRPCCSRDGQSACKQHAWRGRGTPCGQPPVGAGAGVAAAASACASSEVHCKPD